MRGATSGGNAGNVLPHISIHAPHAGCDRRRQRGGHGAHISIHAPHAGCDCLSLRFRSDQLIFQSTHPMRGATVVYRRLSALAADFNPRTPCGVRRNDFFYAGLYISISIHAPHAGCDLGEGTVYVVIYVISIHAPHAGCDLFVPPFPLGSADISIHAPHAGCDAMKVHYSYDTEISIHAPHAGCDSTSGMTTSLSCRISIHAPHAGCDKLAYVVRLVVVHISIHAPHAGCDSSTIRRAEYDIIISIHAPHAGCDFWW